MAGARTIPTLTPSWLASMAWTSRPPTVSGAALPQPKVMETRSSARTSPASTRPCIWIRRARRWNSSGCAPARSTTSAPLAPFVPRKTRGVLLTCPLYLPATARRHSPHRATRVARRAIAPAIASRASASTRGLASQATASRARRRATRRMAKSASNTITVRRARARIGRVPASPTKNTASVPSRTFAATLTAARCTSQLGSIRVQTATASTRTPRTSAMATTTSTTAAATTTARSPTVQPTCHGPARWRATDAARATCHARTRAPRMRTAPAADATAAPASRWEA